MTPIHMPHDPINDPKCLQTPVLKPLPLVAAVNKMDPPTSLTWNLHKWAMSTVVTKPGKKKKMKMDEIDEMGKGRGKGVGKGKAKKKGTKGLR